MHIHQLSQTILSFRGSTLALTFIPEVGARVALKDLTVSLTGCSAPLFHRLDVALPTNIMISSVPSGIVALTNAVRGISRRCALA